MATKPAVSEIIALMEEPRGELVAQLRAIALALPEVEERAVYDGFCREWTPAYYCGDRQLFHVHNFRWGLRATVFVGVRTLEPVILDSEEISPQLRQMVAETAGPRGTKQVKIPIESAEDVAAFTKLVQVKREFVRSGRGRSKGS